MKQAETGQNGIKRYKDKSVKKKYLTAHLFSCMIAKVNEMEKIVRQTLLYDFYGELLNSHQRKLYEDAVFGALSLSEIAQEEGTSRQGVHVLNRRCDRLMEEYEEKLHLIRKFSETKERVERIRRLALEGRKESFAEIAELSDQILQTL